MVLSLRSLRIHSPFLARNLALRSVRNIPFFTSTIPKMNPDTSSSRPPLIVVVGATGTGKSDLAVALARRFDGEIINGDAMQMYAGLPIVTNKITDDEQCGVPHHFLGCVPVRDEPWTVGRFVKAGIELVHDIHSRGKVPILVGGTHYYTQSLLFRDTLNDEAGFGSADNDGNDTRPDAGSSVPIESDAPHSDGHGSTPTSLDILDAPTPELVAFLRSVDPVMADRWHPNDRRKIRRSVEIYLTTGQTASAAYQRQRDRRRRRSRSRNRNDESESEDGDLESIDRSAENDNKCDVDDSAGLLRFPTLVLWPYVPIPVLYPRLDGRVEKMVERGLLSEVAELDAVREEIEREKTEVGTVDMTRGIWVSIGYKEFVPYLQARKRRQVDVRSEADDDDSVAALLRDGLERTKCGTRQYAKRQIRWLRIKLLNSLLRQAGPATGPSAVLSEGQEDGAEGEGERTESSSSSPLPPLRAYTYVLPYEQVSQFRSNVVDPAEAITNSFLQIHGPDRLRRRRLGECGSMPCPTSLPTHTPETVALLTPARTDLSTDPDLWERRECGVCGVVAVTAEEWDKHVAGRRHRMGVRKRRGKEEGKEAWIERMKEEGRARKRDEMASVEKRRDG